MLRVVNLGCTNCGAKLAVGQDIDRFTCGYCGAALVVERSGGTVSLKLVEETLISIRTGTDKTAAELAIRRLTIELQPLLSRYSQAQYLVQRADLAASEIPEAEAAIRAASERIASLQLDIQAKGRKELASTIGCFSSIIWGVALVAMLSSLGVAGVLVGIAAVAVVDAMCFFWILQSQTTDTEVALRMAESQMQEAKQRVAGRAAERAERAIAAKELAELEPDVQALQRRIEDNKRIADS